MVSHCVRTVKPARVAPLGSIKALGLGLREALERRLARRQLARREDAGGESATALRRVRTHRELRCVGVARGDSAADRLMLLDRGREALGLLERREYKARMRELV